MFISDGRGCLIGVEIHGRLGGIIVEKLMH